MMRRSPLTSMPLYVALAIGAALGWTAPALAQTATLSATQTTSMSASSTVSTSTSSATTSTTTHATVPVSGVVTGGPESVNFAGLAKLSAIVVTDPDFGGTPTVVLTIDLSGISGVGASTGAKYVTSDQGILQRGFTAVDTVQYAFPFDLNGASGMSPLVGLASFNLSFNVNTFRLTGVKGSIDSP